MGFSFPSATLNKPNKSSEQSVLFKYGSTTVSTCYFWSIFIVPSLCHKSPQSDPRQIRISLNHLAWKRNKQTWSYFLKVYRKFSLYAYYDMYVFVSSVHFSRSIVYNSLQHGGQASLSITNSRSLLKLMSTESVIPSNHPLSSPSPPTFNLSQR